MVTLYSHQREALPKLHNGSVLVGDVGSGKSRTALAYYVWKEKDRPIYIITTAKKRDSKEWLDEAAPFEISLTVDSWNNIKKYADIEDAFFIFDEQRVVGYRTWSKTFIKIAKKNHWIMLTATPGDTWSDYIPLFIANGFYKNKTDFSYRHIVYDRFAKYPKINRYENEQELKAYRNQILVRMQDQRTTLKHNIDVPVEYDKNLYLQIIRTRWDPYDNEPIAETGKLFYLMRKVVNSDQSRIDATLDILNKHKKAIIFYNFTYELEMIRTCLYENQIKYAEWNGEKHEDIPDGSCWAYLVQYSAGAEGWNCIETDALIFFSQNYSYRMMTQAAGRIDRMNTPFNDLYFYYLRSKAPIDLAIRRALMQKKNFNEKSYKIGKI